MKWKPAPLIKVYEALGAIGDHRIELTGNKAKVYSSSRNKFYKVRYDPHSNSITSNDNGSYWVGYLGYPSIAFLLEKGIVEYEAVLAEYLKGYKWKDINQTFRDDFAQTLQYIDQDVATKYGIDTLQFQRQLGSIQQNLNELKLNRLPSTALPPEAY